MLQGENEPEIKWRNIHKGARFINSSRAGQPLSYVKFKVIIPKFPSGNAWQSVLAIDGGSFRFSKRRLN